ncbi:hypothetical protein, partial [Zoogloea sp.]|uniref:hypothetical protein n=1 Tax=Zoogloea sp. TaxID=49181 RepID=UPI0025D12DEE
MPTPADLQHLALTDGPEAARHALSQALAQGLPPDQDPVAWARLCELLGASLLAIQCWQEAQA